MGKDVPSGGGTCLDDDLTSFGFLPVYVDELEFLFSEKREKEEFSW